MEAFFFIRKYARQGKSLLHFRPYEMRRICTVGKQPADQIDLLIASYAYRVKPVPQGSVNEGPAVKFLYVSDLPETLIRACKITKLHFSSRTKKEQSTTGPIKSSR